MTKITKNAKRNLAMFTTGGGFGLPVITVALLPASTPMAMFMFVETVFMADLEMEVEFDLLYG